MAELCIISYSEEYEEKWDRFVLKQSANGTFLQTRKFLNYHPVDQFKDSSLMVVKGNEIVAVIPAHMCVIDNKKYFISHDGSTFGGIVIRKCTININGLDELFNVFEDYIKQSGYDSVLLKQTGRIYSRDNMDLLDYYYFNRGFAADLELGFYIDYSNYDNDIISNYSSSRRRDYKYSLKNEFSFREICSDDGIREFYSVLTDNYRKFDKTPIHSLEDLLDFYKYRIPDNTRFYGVYNADELAGGAMIFCFAKDVFHTQYLAVKQEKKDKFVNEYMYTNIIRTGKEEGYRYLSFGTSTFDRGKVLNTNLARFKEGFGTKQYNNISYIKEYV